MLGCKRSPSPFPLPLTSFFALSPFFAWPKLVRSLISMDFWVFLSLKTHRNACYAGHQSALVPREKRGSFPEKRLVIQPTRDHIVRKRKRHLEFRLLYRLPILEQITADKKNKFRSLLARREISWQAPIPRPLHVICALSREKARA